MTRMWQDVIRTTQKSMIKMKPFNVPGAASSSLWCSRRFSVRIQGTQQFRCLFWWAEDVTLFGGTLPPKNDPFALGKQSQWARYGPEAVRHMRKPWCSTTDGCGHPWGLEMLPQDSEVKRFTMTTCKPKIWPVGWVFLVLMDMYTNVCLESMDMDNSLDEKMFCIWMTCAFFTLLNTSK